jgi:hypothetical protein
MTEATCSIARLDRSQPPPGYQADRRLGGIVSHLGDRFASLAEAWAHYEARHFPPGFVPGVAAEIVLAAAWRWYWPRAELDALLARAEAGQLLRWLERKPEARWPALLTWPDEQVAEARREAVEMIARQRGPVEVVPR